MDKVIKSRMNYSPQGVGSLCSPPVDRDYLEKHFLFAIAPFHQPELMGNFRWEVTILTTGICFNFEKMKHT